MSQQSLRIAVADDEVDMRDFLTRILPRLGHVVVAAAADGEELVAACRQTQPDLIITDLKMPRCDGLTAIQQLRVERRIPVIFISAYPQELSGPTEAEPDLTTVLVKPVKRSDLETAIDRVARTGRPTN